MVFGPVTDHERRRWQSRDASALVELLKEAAARELPPLAWRLGINGLLGQVTGDFDTRRATFDLWVDFLEAAPQEEQFFMTGLLKLRAFTEDYGPRRIKVGVIADLLADPCPACGGQGNFTTEDDNGTETDVACPACGGLGTRKED